MDLPDNKRFKRNKHKGHPKGQKPTAKALLQIEELIGKDGLRADLLIEYLHRIQDTHRCIRKQHILALAELCGISPAQVYETATFYHHFDVKEDDHKPAEITLRVCNSITCEMYGALDLIKTLEKGINLTQVRIQRVPCVGRCDKAPIVVVGQNPVVHANLSKIRGTISRGRYTCPSPNYISFEAYQRSGGFKLWRAVTQGKMEIQRILKTLEKSQLRGLGGAGFPLGRKWQIVRNYPSPRYLAINIDEGEPGTFKDLYNLERDPFRFLEGALIASYVVGIDKIYIYLRDEYAGIYSILRSQIPYMQEKLGFKTPQFDLRRGAGAYICGEEAAMIESIEGKRGIPRLRPPFIAERGLFDRPTLEHNIESLHWVRKILENGADWFASQGRNGRHGIRSFSVSGRVKLPGVHLAPAGITMNELLKEYCGGMTEGHHFYGYFPGGASGGILPATKADIPLDFDTLQPYGCFIGSAAIIVLSDKDGALGAAKNAMHFFHEESCGKCTPCRVGTAKACTMMEEKQWNQPLLKELFSTMADASICGLGQAAPNPAVSVMKYFPHEIV